MKYYITDYFYTKLFCHCGQENEVVKGNVGMFDELLDGKRKRKIFSSNISFNMTQKCWMKCWIYFPRPLFISYVVCEVISCLV